MEKFKVEYLRLHTIDSEIHTKKYPSMGKLAALLEVNARTILRDISFMRDSLNAPIEYDKQKKGYFYTSPDFTISDISLDTNEALALLLNGKLTLQFLWGTNLFDRVRHGMESLEKRAAIYDSPLNKELASRIQFALETSPFSIKPELEDFCWTPFQKEGFSLPRQKMTKTKRRFSRL